MPNPASSCFPELVPSNLSARALLRLLYHVAHGASSVFDSSARYTLVLEMLSLRAMMGLPLRAMAHPLVTAILKYFLETRPAQQRLVQEHEGYVASTTCTR